jgi:hypothetical protein
MTLVKDRLFVTSDDNQIITMDQKFQVIQKMKHDNSLIEAYDGSTLALLGRDAVQPLEKADKVQERLDSLNQAISMDPNQKEIRLLRANVCQQLPPLRASASLSAMTSSCRLAADRFTQMLLSQSE